MSGSPPAPVVRILAVALSVHLVAGCHVPVIDRGRNLIDGVPRLGMAENCPPEAHPADGCCFGKCDRDQYAPRPILCRYPYHSRVTPWTPGTDCDGRATVMERLIGRRRAAHCLPVPQRDRCGCAGFHYTLPRTAQDDERVLMQAFLFFSVNRSTEINGLRTKDEDILATDGHEVVRCFDGSDVGMSRLEIDGFAFLSPNRILLSVTRPFTVDADHALPGLQGDIDDSDVLLFEATRLGEVTRGWFSIYLDGSDVGLDTDDEDVDAVSVNENGLIISTTGNFETEDLRGKDEDLIQLTNGRYGSDSSGTWKMFFDGSRSGLSTRSGEDINGASAAFHDALFLTTREQVDVGSTVGQGHDILRIPSGKEHDDAVAADVFFHGDAFQLKADSVSAIAVPPWQLPYELVANSGRRGTGHCDACR